MGKSFLIPQTKSATDALRVASKKALQKTAKAADDLVGNKFVDKNTGAASQTSSSKSTASATLAQTDEAPMEIPREKFISQEKQQQIIDDLGLL